MPRVNVEDRAHEHPALEYAGKLLGVQWERLAWRMVRLWSLVTERGELVLDRGLVAAALRVPERRIGRLVDAGLAEDSDDGGLDLEPLVALFGRPEWYQRYKESASAGGQARATLSAREGGKFQAAADWDRDIPAILAQGTATARRVAEELGCSKRTVLRHLRRMVDEGAVVDLGNGIYGCHGHRVTGGDTDRVTGCHCPVSTSAPALPPAPALSPPNGGSSRAGERDAVAVSQGDSDRVTHRVTGCHGHVSPAVSQDPVERSRQRYQELYKHYLAERDRVGASDKVRDPGPIDGPKQVRDMLHRDGFANYRAGERDDELRSAVTLVAELGAAARDRGEARPWRLYAQLWHSRETLRIALDDVAAGRDPRATFQGKTARPRRGGSVVVSTDEEFAEMEREIARAQGALTLEGAT